MALDRSEAQAISETKSSSKASEECKAHALRKGYIIERQVETESLVFEIPIGDTFGPQASLRSTAKAALEISRSVGRIIVKTEIWQRLGAGADSIASLIP